MVTLNFKNGNVEKYDLQNDISRDEFNRLGRCLSNKDSETITGIWFNTENHGITLPSPKRFRRVSFYGELIKKNDEIKGEKIVIQADESQLTITSFYRKNGRMAKVELFNIGKQIFNPERRLQ